MTDPRIGDHYGLNDADRCPGCGHMPGCDCACCEVSDEELFWTLTGLVALGHIVAEFVNRQAELGMRADDRRYLAEVVKQ